MGLVAIQNMNSQNRTSSINVNSILSIVDTAIGMPIYFVVKSAPIGFVITQNITVKKANTNANTNIILIKLNNR